MENQGSLVEPGAIRFERRLMASLQEVWAYLTESDLRGKWLATGEMQLVRGGAVDLHFRHSDLSPLPGTPPGKYKDMSAGHSFTGTILRIDPPRLLSFTWDGGSEVTFELAESGDAVLLSVTHRLLPTDIESQASVLAGWHTHLGILMAVLRGETPPNFWVRHTELEKEYAAALS
jgi:uncharacterized protein YndB with AHSA1/START domain